LLSPDERLGGKPAITAVVDEFVARVAADKRINCFFAGVASDPARLAAFKTPRCRKAIGAVRVCGDRN
jgi:truncated hemoglobin YjbI